MAEPNLIEPGSGGVTHPRAGEELTAPLLPEEIALPPTEDELPSSDGMPMETERHVLQMYLLIETLRAHWAERTDVFVGGNMFVYFSPDQVRRHDFRGPDVFVVQGVEKRERKSWVVWQEGKGPDVVIELLSESTAERDKQEKKEIYQERLRVPEYFWYDPFSGEWAGFGLHQGRYDPIVEDEQERLISRELGLALVRWEGVYNGVSARWLRWATLEGSLLPTPEELAQQARQQAQEAQQQAQWAQQEAQQARQRTAELEELLTRYRARFGELPE
jgi:Uma2 family endonuclease